MDKTSRDINVVPLMNKKKKEEKNSAELASETR